MLLRDFVRARTSWRLAFAAAVLTGLTMVACKRVPLVAPSGSAMTLVAATNVLPVNGSADVTAVILEGAQAAGTGNAGATTVGGFGTPVHDGTVITFTTSLGRIEPAEARTTAGHATVRLIADGRSGTATITAFSGAATQTLDVDIGAAGATHLAVTANPQNLPPTGGITTVSARVEDQQGNGLVGVPVSFSTTKGTLSNTTVLSNDQGFALTTLNTTAEATVTASAGGSASALTGTVLVTLKPLIKIGLTPPTSAMVGVPARFTITPGTDTVITDVFVDWGDGLTSDLLALSQATGTDHLFADVGVVTVTVRATDSANSTATARADIAVAPLSATGTASPSSTTTPNVGTNVTFTATAATGAVVVRYEWDFGDGETRTTFGNQTSHAFSSPGSKVVSVQVVPAGGGPATPVLIQVDVKP